MRRTRPKDLAVVSFLVLPIHIFFVSSQSSLSCGAAHGGGYSLAKSLKELRHCLCILKILTKLLKIVISKPFQSSPSSAILVPFCFRITVLVFFFLSKPLVLVSQHFNRNLRHRRNDSKYHDVAPLNTKALILCRTSQPKALVRQLKLLQFSLIVPYYVEVSEPVLYNQNHMTDCQQKGDNLQ